MLIVGIAAVLGATALGLVVRRRIAFLTRVRSCSMSPTLNPGQLLMATRVNRAEAVARGDIVVVASAELGQMIIKRVIGEPGDQVIIDDRGHIQVNQVPLVEPYVAVPAGPAGAFAVPQDHVLLLGDNRIHSSDSRGWLQPFLPAAAIQGRVVGGALWPTMAQRLLPQLSRQTGSSIASVSRSLLYSACLGQALSSDPFHHVFRGLRAERRPSRDDGCGEFARRASTSLGPPHRGRDPIIAQRDAAVQPWVRVSPRSCAQRQSTRR
ncbi:signal peptidase I [Aminobacter aganoensis]|uniref:signal peptidase I n=1 Tax=Aminobacter aganoensis TaxID=83264 RepID=UPI0035ED4524